MTAQDASDGEIKTFERAMLNECLTGVLTTGRRKTADGWSIGGNGHLIEADGQEQ